MFHQDNPLNVKGLIFDKTTDCCPEQYDVYKTGKQIAYVRLRHGLLTADYFPDHIFANRERIFSYKYDSTSPATPFKGAFDDEKERNHMLEWISDYLLDRMKMKRR